MSHFLDRDFDKKKKRACKHFFGFFLGHLCGAFLPCLHGNGKNCAASPRLFFLFPVFPHAHAWGFRGCAAPPALAPAMRETRERVLPRGTSSELRTGANQAPADEADCVAPTHPSAETAGALKASKRRHDLRAYPHRQYAGTNPRIRASRTVGASKRRHNPKNPGREPGDKPHPKTNPSLGEAAQSPRRVSAFSIRCARAPSSFPQKKKRSRGKTLRGRVFSPRVFQDAAAGGFPLPPLCGRAPELPGRGPRPRRERRLPPRNSRPALPSRFSFRAPSP